MKMERIKRMEKNLDINQLTNILDDDDPQTYTSA
jgi:hypothetical protein